MASLSTTTTPNSHHPKQPQRSYCRHAPVQNCIPFEAQDALIKWGSRLGKGRANDAGNEGFVFQAEIASRQYAVKVFKFFHPASEKY
ncbi:hypothetical protein F4782DRAFT_534619 [Xylaria castorea]|nr:hypothetical protein F4782DRAFT_534619 [Xylaria castorea]